MIRFENGATLTLEVSWAINKDTDSEPFVHLAGHGAGISIQHGRRKFLAEVNGEAVEEDFAPPADIENERDALSKHFIECVRENREPISPAWSGLVNNMVLDAICESSQTGAVVTLDWSGI
jgi:predicted dehydrogenase